MRIDSHQHFWIFDPVRDAWIDDTMQAIRHDFLPTTFQPVLSGNKLDGSVAVQADQSESETRFLLDLATKNAFVKKVVGWVDLAASDIEDRLAFWKGQPKLAGFRHILQAEPPSKMYHPDFRNGIAKLSKFGFTYDILVYPHHLEAVIDFVDAFPDQAFVVDHLAKPLIREGKLEPWKKQMTEIAMRSNVWCKLSGMVTEANLKSWKYEDLEPYMNTVLKTFGPARIMFGSDWPVCLLAASYPAVVGATEQFIKELSRSEQEMIMGGTACRFYDISN